MRIPRLLTFAIVLVLAALVVACGSSTAKTDPTPAVARQAPRSSSDPDSPFVPSAVWKDPDAIAKADAACRNSPRTGIRSCVRDQMKVLDAPQGARDFYDATGRWLVAFWDVPGKLKAGVILLPGAKSPIPQIAFLRGTPVVQEAIQFLADAFDEAPGGSLRPFEADTQYPVLLEAARIKFRNSDDPLDLKHFDIAELESVSALPSTEQQFIVQVGIHNFCYACGIGVAARYTFDFDAQGKFMGVKLLSLCQGRPVSTDVQGLGVFSIHDFSGVNPGRTGVSEPYLLVVPSLAICPEHHAF